MFYCWVIKWLTWYRKADNEHFRCRCACGKHPFPSRTRRLRRRRPMVLHWRRCGRAGGRQTKKRKTDGSLLNIEQASEVSFVGTKREQKRFDEYGANLNQPGSAVKYWFYQWYKKKRDFPLIWLIKYQSESYLENCIHVNLIKTNQISLIYYWVRYVSVPRKSEIYSVATALHIQAW